MLKCVVFIALSFSALAYKLHPKAECIIKAIYQKMDITEDIEIKLQNNLNERDFSAKIDLKHVPIYEALGSLDYKTQAKLEHFLSNYSQLPENLQKSILSCQLSTKKLLEQCQETFAEGCEVVDELVVAKKCPPNHTSVDYAHCVPNCPRGYEEDTANAFICKKGQKSTRAQNLKDQFQTAGVSYRGLAKSYECPENFSRLVNNICIRDCPFGWEDIGDKCLKPSIVKRDNEIFFYKFEDDVDA